MDAAMTAIYKSQRELVELASKYAHAINDGLIGAGGITHAQSMAWKARWYAIEDIRAGRMRAIYLRYRHLDRQEKLL